MNTISTTDKFWDCECKTNYIHLKSIDVRCHRCHTSDDEQPDSRVNEVAALLGPEYVAAPELVAAVNRFLMASSDVRDDFNDQPLYELVQDAIKHGETAIANATKKPAP